MTTSRRGLFGLMAGAAVAPMIAKAAPAYATGGTVHLKGGIVGEAAAETIIPLRWPRAIPTGDRLIHWSFDSSGEAVGVERDLQGSPIEWRPRAAA